MKCVIIQCSPWICYSRIQMRVEFLFSPALTSAVQAVGSRAAAAPAGHGSVLLWRAVAVSGVVLCGFVVAGTTYHATEIHAWNDGLGKWRGGWGWGRGCAIVVILTTHNGRLLHLQTTGVQAKRETENGDKWKWGHNNRHVKQYSW